METKCAAFWKHTNLRSDNRIFPCCRFKHSVQAFDGDLINILDSEEYQELRRKSENNEPIADCQKCYMEEQLGKKSLRQRFNEEYDTNSVSLEYLEVGFDNICNLTCDGCWEEFSSSWGKKLNVSKDLIVKSTTEVESIPDTINKVLFLGGEPLMSTRHKKFLKKFKNLSNLTVVYNTNGTFMLDAETCDLLSLCKDVEFIVSIDGYAELNNKVRSGSKWQDILNFLEQLKGLNFRFTIHTVIHINNWHGLDQLANFVNDNGYDWTVNILTYPHHLNVKTADNIDEIRSFIQDIDIPDKEVIVRHLEK
jgi:sulfatase maturation enzyme AslB (radical SAM superfamily)